MRAFAPGGGRPSFFACLAWLETVRNPFAGNGLGFPASVRPGKPHFLRNRKVAWRASNPPEDRPACIRPPPRKKPPGLGFPSPGVPASAYRPVFSR
jgi:hypothetical protein